MHTETPFNPCLNYITYEAPETSETSKSAELRIYHSPEESPPTNSKPTLLFELERLRAGLPTTSQSPPASVKIKEPTTKVVRKYRPQWEQEYPWLTLDPNTELMYCKWCMVGGESNTFTVGCSKYQKSTLQEHERSTLHQRAIPERKAHIFIKDSWAADGPTLERILRIAKDTLEEVKFDELCGLLEQVGCIVKAAEYNVKTTAPKPGDSTRYKKYKLGREKSSKTVDKMKKYFLGSYQDLMKEETASGCNNDLNKQS
eukprot:TRINITY_DN52790_c0_g1_i2.p1 TRINITY_DN52790_c0_g1~~TRINITY_DN52790_c0_g1_i2.p1  ORF type:complete len:270 (+),score=20.20 TRINITY_DN52790_c0_g1_i2:37-810(+)